MELLVFAAALFLVLLILLILVLLILALLILFVLLILLILLVFVIHNSPPKIEVNMNSRQNYSCNIITRMYIASIHQYFLQKIKDYANKMYISAKIKALSHFSCISTSKSTPISLLSPSANNSARPFTVPTFFFGRQDSCIAPCCVDLCSC